MTDVNPNGISTQEVTIYDASGNPVTPGSEATLASIQAAIEAVKLQIDKLNFDGTKLKTDATLSGTLSITEAHITDPDTDAAVKIASDGTANAMTVHQNSQPLPTGAATAANQTDGGQKAQIVDGAGNVAEVVTGANTGVKGLRVFAGPTDPISDMMVFVDALHHHLHEGEQHQFTYGPAALSNAASLDFRVVVGNLAPTTRTPHIALELDTTGESWLYLCETPTTSANGTQQTIYNRNRNSATAPNTTVWLSPTVTAPGTILSAWICGSGEKAGGQTRDSVEWDLKANTVYLVRITAKNNNNICARLQWYEDLGV